MPKNLPALTERFKLRSPEPFLSPGKRLSGNFRICLIFIFVLLAPGKFVCAQTSASGEPSVAADGKPSVTPDIRWYRTNSSGMALEYTPSRLAALRNEYCLSVENKQAEDLPASLVQYYEDTFSIERRTLYENGKEYRFQWIFRDDAGFVRLTASGTGDLFSEKKPAGKNAAKQDTSGKNTGEIQPQGNSKDDTITGFIEIRDSRGAVLKEIDYVADLSQWEYRFFYKDNILLKNETWFKEPPPNPDDEKADEGGESGESAPAVTGNENPDKKDTAFVLISTDLYYYTRPGSLRAIDRTLHEGGDKISRIGFPPIGPNIPTGMELVTNDSSFSSEFLSDVRSQSPEGITITYTLDDKGRILNEIWKDADGGLYGELQNTWSGDRLQSVLWKTSDQEKLVEYEYDNAGNRIVERDLNQNVLERSVTSRNGRDVEEIYLNGKIILRAYWENGQKISEERVFQ